MTRNVDLSTPSLRALSAPLIALTLTIGCTEEPGSAPAQWGDTEPTIGGADLALPPDGGADQALSPEVTPTTAYRVVPCEA